MRKKWKREKERKKKSVKRFMILSMWKKMSKVVLGLFKTKRVFIQVDLYTKNF